MKALQHPIARLNPTKMNLREEIKAALWSLLQIDKPDSGLTKRRLIPAQKIRF